jgi:hypothetical protein
MTILDRVIEKLIPKQTLSDDEIRRFKRSLTPTFKNAFNVAARIERREKREVHRPMPQTRNTEVENKPAESRSAQSRDRERNSGLARRTPRRVAALSCLYCSNFGQKICTCAETCDTADKLRAKLIMVRVLAEGNLLINPFQFSYETSRIRKIDKILKTI